MKNRTSYRLALVAAIISACILMTLASPKGYADWKGSHKDAIQGVVAILSTNDSLNRIMSYGMGSGFGVGTAGKETDVFVTNRHVVIDDQTNKISRYVYILLEDGALTEIYNGFGQLSDVKVNQNQLVRCEVLYPKANDPEYPDVAILRAERIIPGRVAIPLKSGFEMSAGDKVFTMGFPGSADIAMNLEFTGSGAQVKASASTGSVTVADGIISRTVNPVELNETTVFQHTAAMNHGNSGGPLVDEEGYSVGINTYGFNQADNGVAEYKASLYVDYAMQILDELGIQYDKYGDSSIFTYWPWIAGVAALVTGTVLIIILKRKHPNRVEYRLQGVSGPFAGRRFAVEKVIRMGREPGQNELVFPPDMTAIGRTHCKLELQGKNLFLVDLGSKNGTFLNGSRLRSGEAEKVVPGDSFYIANEGCCFAIDVSRHQKKR